MQECHEFLGNPIKYQNNHLNLIVCFISDAFIRGFILGFIMISNGNQHLS